MYIPDHQNIVGGMSIVSPAPVTVFPVDDKLEEEEEVLPDLIAQKDGGARVSMSTSKRAVQPVVTRQTSGIDILL